MCDRERLLVPSAVIYARMSRGGGGGLPVLVYIFANISIREGATAELNCVHLIDARAPPAPALIPHYLCFQSLAFHFV